LVVQSSDGARHPVIWFHGGDSELPAGPIDLVYTLGVNEYRGERTLQLSFTAVRAAQFEAGALHAMGQQTVQVHDLRHEPVAAQTLPAPGQATWYAEGASLSGNGEDAPFAPRTKIGRAAAGQPLVLWSAPPSPELLRWLVETAAPAAIYLCGLKTTDDQVDALLRSVAGMCKYALGRDGELNIGRMAARLGMTEAVIRHSLLWLEQRGLIKIEAWDPEGAPADTLRVTAGNGERNDADAEILYAELDEQLAEVRAYRRYFLRARVSELGIR
jgi:hypothetical protein